MPAKAFYELSKSHIFNDVIFLQNGNSFQRQVRHGLELNNMKGYEVTYKFKGNCLGCTILKDEEPIHIKYDDIHGSEVLRLRVMFMNKLLEYLGIGPKINYCRNNNGKIINISKDLGYSKNPNSQRKFLTGEHLSDSERSYLNQVASFLGLADIRNDNIGVIEKVERGRQIRIPMILDFFLSSPKQTSLPEFPRIKIDTNGQYITKAMRGENVERASVLQVINIAFTDTIKEYTNLTNPNANKKHTEVESITPRDSLTNIQIQATLQRVDKLLQNYIACMPNTAISSYNLR